MTEQQINDLTIDYILSRDAYARVKKAWLCNDEHGYKACYENADKEQSCIWLSTNNKEEAILKMKLK